MMFTQTVLVVDDEEDIVQLISYNLKKEGFRVLSAFHGMQALHLAREHQPAAIVLDVMMPELDGFEVCRRLRSDPVTATLPVIFLTARAVEADQIYGLELGADDYIQKPVSPRLLVARVKNHVRNKERLVQQFEEQFDGLRDNIASALPHEFRTALNGILGGANLLNTLLSDVDIHPVPMRNDMDELVTSISQSGRRLQKISENFLLYTQMQVLLTQPYEIVKMRKNVVQHPADIIAEAVATCAQSAGRQADVHVHADDAPVCATYEGLSKIVIELVENALKFSQAGTAIHIEAYRDSSHFVLQVADKGYGMGQQEIQRIAAYHQFRRNIHEQQGAGLGLVIIKLLSEIFGGTFTVDSNIGQGTTTTVRLPLACGVHV